MCNPSDSSMLSNVEDLIREQPSFQRIIADGIVTEAEVEEQTNRVINLLADFEKTASDEQKVQIRHLIAETCVMVAVRSLYDKKFE